MRPLLIAALVSVIVFTSCEKIYHCDGKTKMEYKFALPVSITPQKDSFRVGDTIWIENSFSELLHNEYNDKTYKVDSLNFQTIMGITDLNSPSPAISYSHPHIVTYEGQTSAEYVMSEAYESIHLKYGRQDGMYKYKAAFIVDKPGFFLINFFSFADEERTDITDCKNETLYLDYLTNNGTENNYQMIKDAKDKFYNSYTDQQFKKEGGYCFYVK